MAQSLAKRHFLQVTAAQEAASIAPDALMEGLTSYELMLAKLHQDQLRLKQVQSGQGKARLKAELLPDYAPYVNGILAAGQGAQDDVLTTVMLWYLDAGQFEPGLDVAAYVLEHGLKMPDRFSRTTGCLVAEEVAEAALNAQKVGDAFPANVLARTAHLTATHDMPDEVRAKLALAQGRALLHGLDEAEPSADLATAIASGIAELKRAIELHGSCGGKKDLERAERLLKKHADAAG